MRQGNRIILKKPVGPRLLNFVVKLLTLELPFCTYRFIKQKDMVSTYLVIIDRDY